MKRTIIIFLLALVPRAAYSQLQQVKLPEP